MSVWVVRVEAGGRAHVRGAPGGGVFLVVVAEFQPRPGAASFSRIMDAKRSRAASIVATVNITQLGFSSAVLVFISYRLLILGISYLGS